MKNVGRYPDLGTSLAHRALAEDRLNEVSMTHEQIQQILDGRVANYVTDDEVNTQAASKISKSALATEANKYISKSEIGTNYASLVNGTLPTSQRPDDLRTTHLEAARGHWSSGPSTATVYNTNKISVGSVTITDPGFAWIPYIFGTFEIWVSNNNPVVLTLEDNSGRVVAGGVTTRSNEVNHQRLNLSPENLETAYLGSWTFTYKLRFREGTGQARATTAFGDATFYPMPWTP